MTQLVGKTMKSAVNKTHGDDATTRLCAQRTTLTQIIFLFCVGSIPSGMDEHSVLDVDLVQKLLARVDEMQTKMEKSRRFMIDRTNRVANENKAMKQENEAMKEAMLDKTAALEEENKAMKQDSETMKEAMLEKTTALEEENKTMKEAMLEKTEALEEENKTLKQDCETMKEKAEALEEENKTMKQETEAMKEAVLEKTGALHDVNITLRYELDLLRQQHGNAFAQPRINAEQLEEQSHPFITQDENEKEEDNDDKDNEQFSCWSFFCSCCVKLRDSSRSNRGSRGPRSDSGVSLPGDTFSFIISANWKSRPFFTGILIFLLKTIVFGLFAYNNADWTKNFNRFDIPVAVHFSAYIGQFLVILLSVFYKNDLVGALVTYLRGYNSSIKDVFGPNEQHGRERGGGLPWQWALSILLAILDGLIGLVVTFLLIAKSPTVLDVLLNFAAAQFVADIDETAFYFAAMGFFGQDNYKEADFVKDATYNPGKLHQSNKRVVNIIRILSLCLVLLTVVIAWAILLMYQRQGSFAAKKIIVQFDDQVRPALGAHSGFYSLKTSRESADPHSHFQYTGDRAGGGRFAYCLGR